ncbi:MAG: NAD(P)/FAD-dependent oxidoreductase [Actinomycetota bacterium]
MTKKQTADLVVVGAGTVGGWASWFAAIDGAGHVVVLERDLAGQGASSRAAGVVRAQGGTPATVALGRFSIDFYRRQHDLLGTDSGFRELGYLILAVTQRDERDGHKRVAMQREAGLDVRWIDAAEAVRLNPTLAADGHRGGSYCATDGAIDPPRNVRAYSLAMQRADVELRERTAFLGLRTVAARGGRRRVTGVRTPDGVIATERVILTGGPTLRAVGKLVGARIFAGGARHQVVLTEPHPAFEVDRLPMVFDVGAGIYWRLEEGGLIWGMSNPREAPGPAREVDWRYLRRMERRLHARVPATHGLGIRKAWCGTIDYTPDHLPILGPVVTTEGTVIEGTTIASAGGHGMMWGPGVARAAADLALNGTTGVIDVADLGMDRFDEHGRSPFFDPIALPFPPSADDD